VDYRLGLLLDHDRLGNRLHGRRGSDGLRLRGRALGHGFLHDVDDLLLHDHHLLLLRGGRRGLFHDGMGLLLHLFVLDESRFRLLLALEFLRHNAH
jgi:hypothetical protein